MSELFGISMSAIAAVLAALFGVCVVSVLAIYLSNRVMFRLGLRNIPRRGTQTVLIVLGLMLSTLIITAAFTTGDTLDFSITNGVYQNLQRTDLVLNFRGTGGGPGDAAGAQIYAGQRLVTGLEAAFQNDPDIAGFMPFLFEPVPALNPRTRLSEPRVILSGVDPAVLERFGGLRLVTGGRADLSALSESQVYVSERAAAKLDIETGDTITVYAQGVPWELHVLDIVRDERASGVLDIGNPNVAGGIVMPLAAVQRVTDHGGQINSVSVALTGDVRDTLDRSAAATKRLEEYLKSDGGRLVLGLGDLNVRVNEVKRDGVRAAELFGNVFTTFFLVLGLFSIAAGIMLIFMIFVMLAAERRTEMGMARAIGARRAHLVQAFVSEGMAYNVLAGAVGAALGVAAAFVLVVGGARLVAAEVLDFIAPHVTLRTLVVSYCLGTVLTFLTVFLSSLRISQLNIVAAIRGTDDAHRREGRRRTRWPWVLLGIPALVVPPLGLYWLLRKGLGLPWAWIIGPSGIVLGALLMLLGQAGGALFPFSLGISLLPLSAAPLARYYGAPNRLTWSLVGALLAAYWLLPENIAAKLFGRLDGNIEMFVLSGIMIVTGFTLLIVFNARLLTGLFEGLGGTAGAYRVPLLLLAGTALFVATAVALGDRGDGLGQLFYLLAVLLALATALSLAAARFPRFAPALKMGVAYPLANRFRTGMTIAMFSLIIFSLTVFGIINANFRALFAGAEARGGWDVVADTNRNNPVPDLPAALRQEGFDTRRIVAAGRVSGFQGATEVRQPGGLRPAEWQDYPVLAADDAFFAASEIKLDKRARGYDSDRAVWEALRTRRGVAVVDAQVVPRGGFGDGGFTLRGLKATDKEFNPITVEFRDPVSGTRAAFTVIGITSSRIPVDVLRGFYTNERTYAEVYGRPDFRRWFLRLAPGVDAEATAKAVRAALVTKGVQAFSIEQNIEEQQQLGRGFTRIFQAFMGLGLFVGIAALGVIAFRSVVERRQQIGMLRALGYQRGTVALTFLLESSFIALMGILSGVVGACILGRNLMTSDSFTTTDRAGLSFFIPWGEVIAFVVIAYAFALLMTWWPSRGAARVPIAEALRYE
jgi:putative ABC transport system permease protein